MVGIPTTFLLPTLSSQNSLSPTTHDYEYQRKRWEPRKWQNSKFELKSHCHGIWGGNFEMWREQSSLMMMVSKRVQLLWKASGRGGSCVDDRCQKWQFLSRCGEIICSESWGEWTRQLSDTNTNQLRKSWNSCLHFDEKK